MPIFVVPFVVLLGLFVAGYGALRPAREFEAERHQRPLDIGWPVVPLIARLPLPVARTIWVGMGLLIVIGAIANIK